MKYVVLGSTGIAVDCPKIISLDTEYSQKQVRGATLLSISIGVSENTTYILDEFDQVQRFIDAADTIYTWNGIVDWYILTQNGYKFPESKIFDCMLAEHLIDERLPHGLGDYALREFNDNYKEEFWSEYQTYQEAPKEVAYEYEMRDGCYTFTAGGKYSELLRGKVDLLRHVHRLQFALFDTEIKGIKVDFPLMRRTESEMSAKIAEFLPKLREEFDEYCKVWELEKWGEEIDKRSTLKGKLGVERPVFSFTSDSQISELLFGESGLGLQSVEKTKKGHPSTKFKHLKELSVEHSEISTIVEYKEVKAVYATFVKGMLERVENDGSNNSRIYPCFFINGTSTGRISHNNPNMGNLPATGVIRNFFVPDIGCSIVGADYSQLEVVVEANLTEDPGLLKIILEGQSKHDIFKEALDKRGFNLPRSQVKNVNFALQYDAQAKKISTMVGCSLGDAQEIINVFFVTFAGVKLKKDEITKKVKDGLPIVNLFGRVRHFPTKFKNQYEEFKAYRQAYNFIIQGVGADITNMATYLISDQLKSRNLGRLLFSVHDEVICEVRSTLIEESIAVILEQMEVPNEYLKLKYPVSAKPYGPMSCWGKG